MDTTTTGTKKPWYKKSENTIGAPVVGLIGLGILTYIGIHVLPFVILAATNTIYAGVLMAVLAGMVFIALDKDIHTKAFYAWRMITKKIGYAIINQDPIAVIEISISVMKARLATMVQNKSNVGGQLKGLNAKIKANADKAQFDMEKAEQAEKQGDDSGKVLMALEAEGLIKSNQNLTTTRNQIDVMYKVLDKFVTTVDFNIKKTESELEIKKEERKAIMAAHSAMTQGWKVLGGDSPEAEMFNKAMENIAETANQQLAEIDNIMDLSQGIIKGTDLERGVMTDNAMKLLEEFKNGKSTILGTEKAQLVSKVSESANTIEVKPRAKQLVSKTGKTPDKFNKLFDK